jgi:diguanylate cyclase (GGDEF)-like protein
MRRSRFFKYLPTSETIRNSRALKPFGRHLQHHFLWQFNRQSVAGGAAVGMFFGILMPFAQVLFAALCAVVLRVNLPVAALATLVSNPLTFAPLYYLAYRMGNLLLAGTPLDDGIGVREAKEEELEQKVGVLLEQQVEVSGWFDNLSAWAMGVGPSLALGLLVLAIVTAAITYLTVSGLWRLHALRRWRRRPGYQPYRLRSYEVRVRLPRQLALAIGLVGFLVVAAVDTATTARVSLLPLHLMPTLFVTWFVGTRWGIVFAVAMLVVQILIALRGGLSRDLYWQLDLGADFLAVLFLIGMQARLRHMYEELIRVARHDSLTSTLNRNGFYAALDMEIERCRRYGHPFALIYFDCDNFKDINDKLGHRTGDRLLAKVARSLNDNIRKIDAVGRLGGDEFAILLSETEMEAARRTAIDLKEKMDALMKKEVWPVSFSIGVASFMQAPASVEAAIESVDRLMYQVKRSSKDDVAFETY